MLNVTLALFLWAQSFTVLNNLGLYGCLGHYGSCVLQIPFTPVEREVKKSCGIASHTGSHWHRQK